MENLWARWREMRQQPSHMAWLDGFTSGIVDISLVTKVGPDLT